jgi:hypothetical protein
MPKTYIELLRFKVRLKSVVLFINGLDVSQSLKILIEFLKIIKVKV